MKKLILVLSIFYLPLYLISQQYTPNLSGEVVVKGEFGDEVRLRNVKIFLYELIGNTENILDSVQLNEKKFIFPKRSYYTGVYRIALKNTNFLDFVINPAELKNNLIELKINSYTIKNNYNVLNSIENKIKKQYTIKEQSINSKIKLVRRSKNSREQKTKEINLLENELFKYGVSLSNQYPGTYYGMIVSHLQSPNKYVKNLYFDDINFSDECILRSKLLPIRIQKYIIRYNNIKNNKQGFHDAVDVVMKYAKKNRKVAEFCMYDMLDGFYNTGHTSKSYNPLWDELCTYIMEEYIFGEGCGDNVSPSELLKQRASQFKNLQIGGIVPDFSVKDMNGNFVNFKNICSENKYTILMFWASHCAHCMAELPGFANWYNSNKYKDIEMVAVSLDVQKYKWEKTVNDNNFNWINICQYKVFKSPICIDYKIKKTPSIFVLNSKMEVLARPMNTLELRTFLTSNK